MSNSITRLNEQYNNVTATVWTSSNQVTTFRFPLTALGNDFFSLENGVWPGAHVRASQLEVWFEVPSACIYAAGTIVGNLSFGYTTTGYNLQIVQVQDPNLDSMISSRGCIVNFCEPYLYQTAISTSATQVIQIPVAYRSVRAILWGIQKISDLTSNTNGTKLYLMSNELTAPISADLRINSQKRQTDVFTSTLELVAETKRTFPIVRMSDFYSNLTNNDSVNQMLAMLCGQSYCTSCTSGINTQSVQSSMYLEFTLTTNLTSPSQFTSFIFHDKAATITNNSLYLDE